MLFTGEVTRCVSEDELMEMAEMDWGLAAAEALQLGLGDEVNMYYPAEGASWREIDTCIVKLRRAIYVHKRAVKRCWLGGVR